MWEDLNSSEFKLNKAVLETSILHYDLRGKITRNQQSKREK